MPAPLNPASSPTFGKKNMVLMSQIASALKIPSVAEANAATTFDMTDVMFADGTARPTKSTNRVEAQRRWGQTDQFERRGITTYAGGEVTYALAPQGIAGSEGKKMYERIPEGTTGFLVERLAVAKAAAFAAGQFVNVWPVEFDESMPTEIGAGEAAEAGAISNFFVISKPAFLVAILA